MAVRRINRGTATRDREHGQSIVEFALLLPAFLIILLAALDFGRIYLGYINLQQMARIAGNFAADHASAWQPGGDATAKQHYQQLVANDAHAINCQLPTDGAGNPRIPDPAFSGTAIGAPVQVSIACSFAVVTPLISHIVGGHVLMSVDTTFPVKEGAVATTFGGSGGGTVPPPVPDFVGSAQSGYAPLDVTFTDLSTNNPTSWVWVFGNGQTSFTRGPQVQTYTCTGTPGTVCQYSVQLRVGNAGGFATQAYTNYITVKVPPATGPIAEFTASPRTGVNPLTVNFAFFDVRAGAVTYTKYEWDFNGDGVTDRTSRTTSWPYNAPGRYDVALKVTDNASNTDTQIKTAFIVVDRRRCTVPDFGGVKTDNAQSLWSSAGFTTTVAFNPAPGKNGYKIKTQTITGGTVDPQPDGCDSPITVGS